MILEIPEEFNWLTKLTELSEGAEISSAEFRDIDDMAGRWPTCACGQLCKLLPRMHDGCPLDAQLREWGGSFSAQVNKRQWCKALATFQKIEARTTELLERQGVILSPSSGRR